MQIREEVARAVAGYTVSVEQKVVLGRFRDVYFMRSGQKRLTLSVDDTDPEKLHVIWRRFRADALARRGDDGVSGHEPAQEMSQA